MLLRRGIGPNSLTKEMVDRFKQRHRPKDLHSKEGGGAPSQRKKQQQLRGEKIEGAEKEY